MSIVYSNIVNNKVERYDFQISYEIKPNKESFFPYRFTFESFPNSLEGIISHHEYQNIVELLKFAGEPHNFLFRDIFIVFSFLIFMPSILAVKLSNYIAYSYYFWLTLLLFFFTSFSLAIYKLYNTFKKRKAINYELKKRGIELKVLAKLRIYNLFITALVFIQLILTVTWVEMKWTLHSLFPNLVEDYQIIEIFIYIFIGLDVVFLIYLIYNYLLFTKFSTLVSNKNQSEYLTFLVDLVNKYDVVPFYLSYNSQQVFVQPLLFSSENDV